jgi:regulator of RNase E activity RraA
MNASIRAMYSQLPPMVGFATTATFRCAAPADPQEPKGNVTEQIRKIQEIPSPRVMVIQDLDDPSFAAVFGEVMVSTYQSYGCVGLVTNGFARDLPAIRRLNFPCFASGIQVSHSYARLLEFNVPVNVGGVTIRPGDLLHGDGDGVTTIPLEIADQVADACDDFLAVEEIIISTARQKPGDPAAYEEAHRRANAKLEELRARLRFQAYKSQGSAKKPKAERDRELA